VRNPHLGAGIGRELRSVVDDADDEPFVSTATTRKRNGG
jgi:hypothetical protein